MLPAANLLYPIREPHPLRRLRPFGCPALDDSAGQANSSLLPFLLSLPVQKPDDRDPAPHDTKPKPARLRALSELMLTSPAKLGEGGRVGAMSGAERAPLPPPGQRGLLTLRGEGGVSGACPAESSRAGHPKGRKRRSGWDVRADVKGWTRELALDVVRGV